MAAAANIVSLCNMRLFQEQLLSDIPAEPTDVIHIHIHNVVFIRSRATHRDKVEMNCGLRYHNNNNNNNNNNNETAETLQIRHDVHDPWIKNLNVVNVLEEKTVQSNMTHCYYYIIDVTLSL